MEPTRFRAMKLALQKTFCRGTPDIGEYERCVVCRAVTDIRKNMPVKERKCYVPGAGQLCRKCCIELYGTDDLRSLQSAELDQMFLGRE